MKSKTKSSFTPAVEISKHREMIKEVHVSVF